MNYDVPQARLRLVSGCAADDDSFRIWHCGRLEVIPILQVMQISPTQGSVRLFESANQLLVRKGPESELRPDERRKSIDLRAVERRLAAGEIEVQVVEAEAICALGRQAQRVLQQLGHVEVAEDLSGGMDPGNQSLARGQCPPPTSLPTRGSTSA